jgi:sugar diacid utilization regulator
VVSGERASSRRARFLARLVVQHAGTAIAHARQVTLQRGLSRQLRHTRAALADATSLLDWNMAVRERLKQVVTSGGGAHDIAFAVYDMTGHTVAIEDPNGNLTAWAGPEEPRRGPLSDPQRQDLIARAMRVRRPIHEPDRVVAVAHREDRVLGLLSLVEPTEDLGEGEMLAVEDGATLLALELDHTHELAEAETRLGRNVLAELLEGSADPVVIERAQALGFDADRPQRVVMIEAGQRHDQSAFYHAVRRAARDNGYGTWLTLHGPGVALVTDRDEPWEPLRKAILDESGVASCRLGVGQSHRDPTELPTSVRQARLALKLHAVVGGDQAVEFEQLGIYRLLADVAETTDLERYITTWLRPLEALLDYDTVNRSEFVATLSEYLEAGGRHHIAAKALNVHRSTLKYRMQRIREITGCDLSDSDTRFNLQLSTRAWQTLVRLRPPGTGAELTQDYADT